MAKSIIAAIRNWYAALDDWKHEPYAYTITSHGEVIEQGVVHPA